MSLSNVGESDRLDDRGPADDPPYDVFLSYNSEDGPVVRNIARRLRESNVRVWFDEDSMRRGGPWQKELAARLLDSRACAVFMGPHDIIGWERLEMEVAMDRGARDHDFRVFAVLLPEVGFFDASMLPPFLATKQWVDLREGPESAGAIQDLVNAIHGVAPQTHVASDDETECPYRGLEVFEEEHEKYFFGRRAQVQRLLEGLRRDRFLAIVGQSGVGKSSLLRAGLLPRLRAGAVAGSALWRVLLMRPGAHPAMTLASKIVAMRPGPGMQGTVDRLASDERTLHMAATLALVGEPFGSKLLLVVDQFEEIFTLCRDAAERSAFLQNVLYAATISHGATVIVLAMRADFYPQLAQFPEFAQVAQSHHMLVARLGDSELREIIQEPAYTVGLTIEQGLADTILADVEREPGNLPLLEHSLLETWRHRRGRMLTLEGYRASGGVQHGLGERSEAVYNALSDAGQMQARNVFLRLIQPGEGTEDTRRRVAMAEVTTSGGEAVSEVIRQFVDARLLTTSTDDATGEHRIEISHEAVITGWERCRRWVDEDRAGLLIHRRLTVAAQEWKRYGKNKDDLYRGAPLATAMEWRSRVPGRLNWLEQDFLDAGSALERAGRRAHQRRIVVGFAALVAVLALVSSFAVIAVHEQSVATSRQLAAEANQTLNVDPALSLTLALQAQETASTMQADEALRQATAESRGRSSIATGGGPVFGVRFLPHGDGMVSGSADGAARIWNLSGGLHQKPIALSHGLSVRTVSVSPDGQAFATGGADHTVRLTRLIDGQSRLLLTAPAAVVHVEFSHNGQLLAATLTDGTVHVLDMPAGRERMVLPVGVAVVVAASFSSDDATLATASAGAVQIWRVSDGAKLRVLSVGSPVYGLAFSPSTHQVAAAGRDGKVRIWEAETGVLMQELPVSTTDVYVVRFSPDGQSIAAAGLDGSVYLWDRSGLALATLRGHNGSVYDLDFGPRGDTVVSAGSDGTIRTWAAQADAHLRSPVTTAVFDAGGTRIVSGGPDGHLRVWRRADFATLLDIPDHSSVSQALFSADGSRIISFAGDGIINVRDSANGSLSTSFNPGVGGIRTVTPDPDDRRLVIGGATGGLRVVDYRGAAIETLSDSGSPVNAALFSPDGHSLLAGRDDGSLTLWGPDRRPVTIKPVDYRAVYDTAFSSDGARIASADASGSIDIWDLTGNHIAAMRGHEGPASAVHFRHDGQQLVSSGADGTVRVWDVRTQTLLMTFDNGDGSVSYVDVSPDGETMLESALSRQTLRLLSCAVCGPLDDVIGLARSHAFRPLNPDEERRFTGSG